VRVYNDGSGTAHKVLITVQLPPGVAVQSTTGKLMDADRMRDGLQNGTRVVREIEVMNPGVEFTTEFSVRVSVGLTVFAVEYSVAMEDERARCQGSCSSR